MVDDVSGVGPVPKEFHGEALCNALAEESLRLLASVLLTWCQMMVMARANILML